MSLKRIYLLFILRNYHFLEILVILKLYYVNMKWYLPAIENRGEFVKSSMEDFTTIKDSSNLVFAFGNVTILYN